MIERSERRSVTAIAVVLAAGEGKRLGGVAKALLPIDQTTFLARILATAAAAGAGEAIVVVGAPFGDVVADEAARLGARVVVNPAPARGMASSVAVGFAALAGAAGNRALLWPVDHPWVRAETVAALLAVDADVAVPRHGGAANSVPMAGGAARPRGAGGHPAAVAPAVWPALAACAEVPDGARAVLRDPRWRRVDLAVEDGGVLRDLDTPAGW